MKISLDYPNSIETRIIKSHDIILLKCLFFFIIKIIKKKSHVMGFGF